MKHNSALICTCTHKLRKHTGFGKFKTACMHNYLKIGKDDCTCYEFKLDNLKYLELRYDSIKWT